MERTIRAPRQYSVCDFILHGVISENDVLEDGKISEEVRKEAERLMELQKPTIHTRPQSAPLKRTKPRKEDVDLKCTICFAKPRSHIFIPCFHFHTCQSCALRVRNCPVCRSRIDVIQRVWY